MTKATYDTLANKFRGLWGKEAGWAQSVLFTANLKAFSERLVAKTEDHREFEKIKIEEDGTTTMERVIVKDEVPDKSVKREAEDEEEKLIESKHNVVRTSKRRKKA